jgi:hypothetical protein
MITPGGPHFAHRIFVIRQAPILEERTATSAEPQSLMRAMTALEQVGDMEAI